MAVVIETKEMLQTVVASLVAGIGISVIFSIAIWGAARFVDLSGSDRRVAAAGAAALGIFAFVATLATAAFGIVVMMSK